MFLLENFVSLTQPWIKICGITQNKDADYAAQLGVNALGFVFYPKSPRSITSKVLPKIIENLKKNNNVAMIGDGINAVSYTHLRAHET